MSNQESLAKFCENNVLDIPKVLLDMRDIKPLAVHGESSIFYKDLERDLINIEFHTRTPCIVYIKTGKEVITTFRNETFEIGPGDIIFLPKGLNLFSDYIHERNGLNAYLLFFGSDVLSRFLSTELTPPTVISNEEAIFKMKGSQVIKDFFNSLHSVCDLLSNSSHLLQVKLLELLYLLDVANNGHLRRSLLAVQRGRAKRNIKRLMDQYAISNLSAKELAALSGRSVSAFNRDFKSLYGTTPKQWLIEQRISHAHSLLSTKQWSVTAAAIEVGYSNVSHFITAFKKIYGKTPHQIKIEN
ncbi:MAG: helix-turn-helix domain-containing protein [Candidatus Thiodiazotropha sp. (ex. Lucinisca nassula)]|nr:helix-turn-helix domain-containing protein [Candidatus Thiodiazotropha sp. (ex. Lucinisca nassula)]MBW9276176.1 helix-turn-helix domain-containing protein [Candidatus Thiodiazotropha sp. (ex. Lucinisca nassula)]PUB81067.1 MAG: AraC family transcriptional regulator [gamma proteobacterium symbiont of Ctena orbiculata]PUB81275.1 MAG: AraC family transcriptional regulator [gamma proteobacterium symbiont of Ctena orbiculata]